MSLAIGNIILQLVEQLTKPTVTLSLAQALFAIISALLTVQFIGDDDLTYPNATPELTAQSKN